MPRLRLPEATGAQRDLPIEQAILTFGRAGDNDLVLDRAGVSRFHGRFVRDADGQWWVEDLGSKNGILVDGLPTKKKQLRHGDTLTVGSVTIVFEADKPSAPPAVAFDERAYSAERTVEWPVGARGALDRARLQALCDLARRLLERRDINGLIDEAYSALRRVVGVDTVVVGVTCELDLDPDSLIVRPEERGPERVLLSRSVLRRAIEDRRVLLISETAGSRQFAAATSIVSGGIRSAICVPLTRAEEVTGFVYVDSRARRRPYLEADAEFVSAIAGLIGTAIENVRLQKAERVRERMAAELATARRVQTAILPSDWPGVSGWEFARHHAPCWEVAGDYYDAVLAPDGRAWLVIADAAGKGAPAALLASSVHAGVHALVGRCAEPGEFLHELNGLLGRRELGPNFVTCLAAVIVPSSGAMQLASAGHPDPVFIDTSGQATRLPVAGGPPLCIEPDTAYEHTDWRLPNGRGSLLMYTDGVSEALDAQAELFGETRLMEALTASGPRDATGYVTALRQAVDTFRGGREPTDDVTILVCSRR